jgi:RNA polymerase sigma-70 factor (ECF subfamily)
MSEVNVVQQLVSNCPKTQTKVWDTYYKSMFRVSFKITQNIEDAEDVINESFMSLFKYAHNITSTTVGGYLKRLVINKSINKLRTIKTKYDVSIENVWDYGYTDHSFTEYDFKILIGIIDTLPKGYQSVFKLFVLEGLRHSEIAKLLNIDEGTSRSQLAKAKKQLQKKVKFVF